MAVSKRKILKACFKVFLFSILLVAYYFLYIESAIKQYQRGRTTMAESFTEADELQYPVFMLCPQLGFKLSSFEYMINKSKCLSSTGVEKYLWKQKCHHSILENVSSIPDIYMNMSYNLEEDWEIQVIFLING
jgi:hypothetical protein